MDLKKFKKFTCSPEKISKNNLYNFNNIFEYLKITKVINYYTLEVIIYNNDKLNKWNFILNDVDLLDDKLTNKNRDYMANTLESMCLNKYLKFSVTSASISTIYGRIFDTSDEYNCNYSLNTTLINLSINLSILRDKIKKNEGKKYRHLLPYIINTETNNTTLETIYEEDENDN